MAEYMLSAHAVDEDMVRDVRIAVQECKDRGLFAASKWASELLLSIIPSKRKAKSKASDMDMDAQSTSDSQTQLTATQVFDDNNPSQPFPRHPHAPPVSPIIATPDDESEEDDLKSARIYFDSREYLRVPRALRHLPNPSSKAKFLVYYSQYLVFEKDSIREWQKQENTRTHQSPSVNENVAALVASLANVTDPWILFLKALFLSRLGRKDEAMEAVIMSVSGFCWNWSAWSLLAKLISDGEELQAMMSLLPFPPDFILMQMFQLKTLNDLHTPSDNEVSICDRLLSPDFFPHSVWLMSQRACALYHQHNFRAAEAEFDRILSLDPYRIDEIDIYSNMLYVTENALKLSHLAHDFLVLEKDRPEICCLMGNHYSIRAEHAKAIKYFRRATQLDRTFLSAWTLMGHEYVEMKNPHAAIVAYRTAIDVDRKDYRAWYGLGQIYELLSMHNYALYYYQYATALRPYDTRLWQAQASLYRDIGRSREAIECLKRALIPADEDQIGIVLKLANLHHGLGEAVESAAYHERVIEMSVAEGRQIDLFAYSCLQAAAYQMKKPDGDLQLARGYCSRVAKSNAEETVRAADMLRELDEMIRKREEERQEKTIEVFSPAADVSMGVEENA